MNSTGWFLILVCTLSLGACSPLPIEDNRLRIAMFHMSPKLGALEENTRAVSTAMTLAAKHGADWMITPELALTGYRFARTIGTDWIKAGPDVYVKALQQQARTLGLPLFLGHLEEDKHSSQRFNTLFVIDADGKIIARHRKINTIPVAEDWSSKGLRPTVAQLDGIRAGLLICADAWPADHAAALRQQGVDLIVSAATWPPGPYGPADTWEKRSGETGLPLFVNNRTGIEQDFDIQRAESVVSMNGQRLFSFANDKVNLLLLDWDLHQQRLLSHKVISFESSSNLNTDPP